MSTRYVWKLSKDNSRYKSETAENVYAAASSKALLFFQDFDFDERTGIYTPSGSGVRMSVGSISNSGNYLTSVSSIGRYIADESAYPYRTIFDALTYSGTWQLFIGSGGKVNANLMKYQNGVLTGPYEYARLRSTQISSGSTDLGNVSSNSRDTYKEGVDSDGFRYTYLGSDNVDPSSITYNKKELTPGDSIVVTTNMPAPRFSGMGVGYVPSYSVDGGNTWKLVGKDEAFSFSSPSITITIPQDAKSFQVRATARDQAGYVSQDYTYGPTLGVSAMKAYVSPAGKARAANKMKVSPGGKAREVVKGYIGVNGKARKFL